MDQLVVLLPTIPLVSALLTHLLGGVLGRSVSRISVAGGTASFLIASILLGSVLSGHEVSHVAAGDSWGSLLFDPLSVLMGLLIAGISLLVRIYSVRYMAEEMGYARFFVLLDLMTAALLIMVAAGDLVTLLISWHLIGVLLYFLLGQDTCSTSAYRYGFWTFITYRFGDLPLVLAAVVLFHTFHTWSLPEIFAALAADPDTTTFYDLPVSEVVGGLIAMSAFARSAQFLLHTWLPYTMDGPTPVSALMHAGIVNAGGFLINRFAPVFAYTDNVLHWVFIVGVFTAVIGSVLMLSQHDIKKSLGYSTMGQMGFMIMECGVGAFSLAVFHLIAHGLFKGTLFLSAGGIIGEARQDDGVPKDDLYTFIVERRPARNRQPWLLMAGITLAIPVLVLLLSHLLVAPNLFQKQGAIILLFFGWVTGAQLLFATYNMRSENPWRLIALIVFSFTIVVIGYTLISHAFDIFLYPDPDFGTRLYKAAGIDFSWFVILVVFASAAIVLGWLRAYYTERGQAGRWRATSHWWRNFYSLVWREFHILDIYTGLTRSVLAASARVNVWLRWG
ncbi:MAG: NADH-quinone oxidoreductase subunit L [Gammaproteobacteria bacterium]|nr:NADH-quinone oxidoreductase subunit L [Gammaproteobacteria bacterium]